MLGGSFQRHTRGSKRNLNMYEYDDDGSFSPSTGLRIGFFFLMDK